VLGATVAKLRALAERCEEVVVLTDSSIPGALPENCRVRTFASRTRLGRGIRFGIALASELARRPRPGAVVAHMCPIYAVLAAPLARPAGARVLLWYAHWNRTRTLELATRLSNAVVSVDTRSVPVASPKVVGIGHGIDLDQFPCAPRSPREGLRAVVLGRYSETKGIEAVVRGVAVARANGLDLTLACHGPAITPTEETDRARLAGVVAELGLEDAVALGGPIPRSDVASVLASTDVLVNNHRSGAPDKVVYEACAACCPVLVSNPLFDELLDDLEPRLRFPVDDADALADRFADLAALNADRRVVLGRELRSRVADRHSVGSWADAVLALAAQPSASS
jgi:glycosyltransferase involved in cell wall biosynthesis